MLDIMKFIHSCGYIHRDIKPDNFVIGYDIKSKLYSIDFGLAKKFIKRGTNGEHIPFKTGYKFCGTARYASIAAHKGHEQSRKDDLEAMGYVLIYLFCGTLPWQGIKHSQKRKKEEITEEKLYVNLPREFLVYLKYVRNLEFAEVPEYSSLIIENGVDLENATCRHQIYNHLSAIGQLCKCLWTHRDFDQLGRRRWNAVASPYRVLRDWLQHNPFLSYYDKDHTHINQLSISATVMELADLKRIKRLKNQLQYILV